MPENKAVLKVVAEIQDAIKKLDQLNAKIEELRNKDVTVKIKTDEIALVGEALKRVEADIKSLISTVDKINSDVIKPRVEGDQAAAALKKVDDAAKKTRAELKKLADKNVIDPLSDAIKKEANEVKREMNKLVSDFSAKAKKLNDAAKRADFKPMSKSAKLMKRDVVQAAEAVIKKFNQLPASIDKTSPSFVKLAAKAKQAQVALKAFKNSANDVKTGTEKMVSSLKRLKNAILSVKGAFTGFVAVLIAKKIFDLGLAATSTAIKFESMQRAFEAIEGSAEAAGERLGFLRDLSDTLGLKFEGLTQNFLRLTAASQGTAFEGQLLADIFTSVSLAASGLQLSAEDVTGIFFALEQTISKGTVQAEELRRQLGNRLPGAFKLMARGLKITEAQLSKFLKQGVISAEEGLSALALQMIDTFGPAAIANIDSTRSELNRLANTVFDLKLAFARELLPSIANLANRLSAMGEDGEAVFEKIGGAVSTVIDFVTFLVSNINSLDLVFDVVKGKIAEFAQFIAKAFKDAADEMNDFIRIFTPGGQLTSAMAGFTGALADGMADAVDIGKAAGEELDTFMAEIEESRVSNEESANNFIIESRARLAAAIKAAEEGGTTVTKEELKKREKAYEDFFETILKLAERLDEALKPPDISDPEELFPGIPKTIEGLDQLKEKAIEVRSELDEIRDSPVVTQEQIDRANQLESELNDITRALRNTSEDAIRFDEQTQTLTEFGEKVREVLSGVINESREFRSAFNLLPADTQQAVTDMIEDFSLLAESADFTGDDLREFVETLSKTFSDAGVTTNSFAKDFEGLARRFDKSAGGLVKSLNDIASGADKLKTSKEAEDEALQSNIKSTKELGDAMAETSSNIEGMADDVDEVASAAESSAVSLEDLRRIVGDEAPGAFARFRDAVAGGLSEVEALRRVVGDELPGAYAKLSAAQEGLTDGERQVAAALEKTGKLLGHNAKELANLGQEYADGVDGVDEFVAAHDKIGTTLDEVVELMGQSSKATAELAAAEAEAALRGQELSNTVEVTADGLQNFSEGVTSALSATLRLDPELASVAQRFVEFAKGSGVAAEQLPDLTRNFVELAKSEKEVTGGLENTNRLLSELRSKTSEVAESSEHVEGAFRDLGEGLEKSADGIKTGAEATEGLATATEEARAGMSGAEQVAAKLAENVKKIPEGAEPAAKGIQKIGEAAKDAESGIKGTAEGIEKIAKSTKDLKIPEGFNSQLSELGSTSQQFQEAVGRIAEGISKLAESAPNLKVPEGFVEFIQALGAAASENSESFAKFASSFQSFASATAEVVTPEGLVEFIAELLSATSAQAEGFERFSNAFKILSDAMTAIEVNDEIVGFIEEIGESAASASEGMETFAAAFKQFTDSLAEADLEAVPEQLEKIAAALKEMVKSEVREGLKELSRAIEDFGKALGEAATNAERLQTALNKTVGNIRDLIKGFEDLKVAIESLEGTFELIGELFETLAGLIKNTKAEAEGLVDAFLALQRDAVPAINAVADAMAALNTELKLATQNARELNEELAKIPSPADDTAGPI